MEISKKKKKKKKSAALEIAFGTKPRREKKRIKNPSPGRKRRGGFSKFKGWKKKENVSPPSDRLKKKFKVKKGVFRSIENKLSSHPRRIKEKSRTKFQEKKRKENYARPRGKTSYKTAQRRKGGGKRSLGK